MESQSFTYDTYCSNRDCIDNHDAYFNYSLTNYHVQQHPESIVPIHPISLQRFLCEKNEDAFQTLYKEKIQEKMKSSIEEINKKIIDFLHNKFFNNFGQDVRKRLNKDDKMDMKSLMEKLRGGDIELMKKIVRFLERQKQMSFSNFLKLDDEQPIAAEINQSFSNLCEKIIQILDIAFEDFDDLRKIGSENNTNLYKSAFEIKLNRRRAAARQIFINNEDLEVDDDSEESEFSIYNNFMSKKKPIVKRKGKQSKMPKNIRKDTKKQTSQTSTKSFFKQVKPEQQVILLNEHEIIIHTCSNPKKTFSYISQNYPKLTTFHIFDERFANKETITRIFRYYKQLETLTFNCNHQFEANHLMGLSNDQLAQIKTLDLKWAYGEFFKEYHILHSFPIKGWSGLQRLRRVRIPLYIWDLMISNDTLWLESDAHVHQMKYSKNALGKIKHLYFATASHERMGQLKELTQLTTLTNLVVLNLRAVSFVGGEEALGVIIERNPSIATLIIYQCYFQPNSINCALACLQSLKHLTSFSLTGREYIIIIDPSIITNLLQIQNLYLSKINFSNQQGFTNSNCLKKFINLKKLKRLELYACNPVFSDFFTYLHEDALANLQLLNVGVTQVDGTCKQHLLRMPKLQFLNIDSLKFTGDQFLELCKHYYAKYGKKWPLKSLSIEQFTETETVGFRFRVNTLKQIGKYLPNLQYLLVVACNNLKGYGFEQFRKLQTLAVDSELNKALEEKKLKINRFVI